MKKNFEGMTIKKFIVSVIVLDEHGNEIEIEFVPDKELEEEFQEIVGEMMDGFGASERVDANA